LGLPGREFQRILEGGRRKRLGHLEVHWMDNSTGHPRLGLMVPRFQFTAVARNRLRRRLREIWRRELEPEAGSLDLVVRTRKGAYGAGFSELRDELKSWWQSARAGQTGREAV
jgi:ribonuclease P protein component